MKILILFCLAIKVETDSMSSRLSNCGISQGCWLMPPGCEQSSGPDCMGIISWIVSPNGIQFSMITYVNDLLDSYIISKSIYGAVGFSLDPLMGDDTVFVCAINSTGQGTVSVNWNDQYSSERQYEASDLVIANEKVSLINGRMNCEFQWVFGALDLLSPAEKSKIFNLSNPKLEVYMLFARGSADPNTLLIHGHSVADGLLYPFVSTETVSFCPTGCGQVDGMDWITNMHQAVIPQSTKQKLTITHAVLMLLTCLVFMPSAILISRFGKKYLYRYFGTLMWLHVHWLGGMLGFLCMTAAFFCIYYQASFRLIQCSSKCTSSSFFRQLHALIGTFLYLVVTIQILISALIPKVTSNSRIPWNFFHIFLGYGIWLVGCIGCFIGLSLPKTGLFEYYARWPQQIMAISLCITLVCFILGEWIIHKERFASIDPDRVEKLYAETRLAEEEDIEETPSHMPLILIAFNAISGTVVASMICIMLVNAARANGFKL